jgi:hypothetical protein
MPSPGRRNSLRVAMGEAFRKEFAIADLLTAGAGARKAK